MARRGSALRDLLGALAIVGIILGAMYLYTSTWPPMVVVESASMMHPHDDPGYGNIGTIDPGDLVLVKQVDGLEDVELAVDGEGGRYGRAGDVIVYRPNGATNTTPIIHRAITLVEVFGAGDQRSYRVYIGDGQQRSFGPEGIFLPELGIAPPRYTEEDGWKPTHGGLLTQGDNPQTNPQPDQVTANPLSEPVQAAWIEGEARGEIPWVGLLKLSISPNLNVNPPPDGWARIGNAYAPPDLWVMLFLSVTALVILPLSWDVLRAWRDAADDGMVPPLKEFLRVHVLRQPPGEPVDDEEPFEVVDPDEAQQAADRPKASFQTVSAGTQAEGVDPEDGEGARKRTSFQVVPRGDDEDDDGEDASTSGA